LNLRSDFAAAVRDARVVAQLVARRHVVEHLADAQADAVPFAEPLDYTGALAYLRGLVPMSDTAFDELAAGELLTAFRVVDVADEVVTGRILAAITRAVEEGTSLAEFQASANRIMRGAGLSKAKPSYLETVFRTNVQTAYSVGAWQQFHEPGVAEWIQGYEYVAVMDDRTRETHAMMDSRKFPEDSPVWAKWWPPNGFNCRCTVLPVFITDKKPRWSRPTGSLPDVGFRTNPALATDE